MSLCVYMRVCTRSHTHLAQVTYTTFVEYASQSHPLVVALVFTDPPSALGSATVHTPLLPAIVRARRE